jgi:hypothetical protein
MKFCFPFRKVSTSNQSSEVIDPAIRDVKLSLQHIMSFLDLQSLGRSCCVSRKWKRAAYDEPQLWKSIIYRQIAFGNDKWAKCFGSGIIKDEPVGADFASLPWREVIEDFRNITKVFPMRKATDCLMLVRLPKTLNGGLSINSIGSLARRYFPDCDKGYRDLWSNTAQRLENQSISESYWVLMTKDILPESRWQSYPTQQQMVADLAEGSLKGYRVPGTLEAITCILSQYFDSRMRLFGHVPRTYTRCLEKIGGKQLVVGDFASDGLAVNRHYNDNLNVAIASLRKFS